MDLLELQQRANVIVQRVNDFEASLTSQEVVEDDLINERRFVDIYSLRPVLNFLFGKTIQQRTNSSTFLNQDLYLYMMTPPVGQSTFKVYDNEVVSLPYTNQTINVDLYNKYNMVALDAAHQNDITSTEAIKRGVYYAYSANIADALAVESQLANVFKWNTTNINSTIENNTFVCNRQCPGVVMYYLGNQYDNQYTATIPHAWSSKNINDIRYFYPPIYGAYYQRGADKYEESQVGLDMGHEACRVFIPSTYYCSGKLLSPQQTFQPAKKYGSSNYDYGYNWQGNAVYHELVYKDLRAGCNFTEPDTAISDNDPQGLVTRLALAAQKSYYYNRPWFTELDTIGVTEEMLSNVADNIIANAVVAPTEDTEPTEPTEPTPMTTAEYLKDFRFTYDMLKGD